MTGGTRVQFAGDQIKQADVNVNDERLRVGVSLTAEY